MRKTFLFFLLVALSCSSTEEQISHSLKIKPYKSGFNIYSAENDLLLEFTTVNTDSLSLETLQYIYETVEEYEANPNHFKVKYKNKPKNIIAYKY